MNKILNVIMFIGFCILFGYGYVNIPEEAKMTLQWGMDGQVNSTTSKWPGLILMPGVALLLSGFLWLLPIIEPRKQHIKDSKKAYTITILAVQLLMLVVYAITVLEASGHQINTNKVVLMAIGGLFAILGNYLPKVRSNFFLGIRTPWTLSSEEVWNKTHRIAGILFVLLGILFFVTGFISGELMQYTLTLGVISVAVYLYIYSWFEFNKQQKNG